jgi:hypothetical protein
MRKFLKGLPGMQLLLTIVLGIEAQLHIEDTVPVEVEVGVDYS